MDLSSFAKPRFVLAALALVVVGVLMGIGRVDQTGGLTVIIGVLAAFGAYTQSDRAQQAAETATVHAKSRLPTTDE
jgi:type IV secretory pathway VirB2 component (pilin)